MNECNVIAVANQKGGKTTSVVNLGAGLAMQGYSVLAIDADPQGSLTAALGEKKPDELDFTLATVMTALMNDERVPYYEESSNMTKAWTSCHATLNSPAWRTAYRTS